MMRRTLLGTLLSLAAVAACDHSSAGSATPSGSAALAPSATPSGSDAAASASASPSASAPETPEAGPTEGLGNPPRLADADIETLEKGLKCAAGVPAGTKTGPCRVLGVMEKCNDWNPASPSGDGRYMGHGWVVDGAKTTDIVAVLRSHSVPQSEVKPWQLPVKIAVSSIGKEAGPAFLQADKAINAYSRHDVPPPKNAAVDFLKQKSDWANEAPAARTMGAMVETFSDRPTYICQGPGQQIEIVQQASADIGLKSDGLYAELWASSW